MRGVILAAGGKGADKQAGHLIPEKTSALMDAQVDIATDALLGRAHHLSQKIVSAHRRRVGSNYRRLKRRKRHDGFPSLELKATWLVTPANA